MERLNEIMGRAAQRRQNSEQRPSQGAGSRPAPAQQTHIHQPLPEQTARLGQRNTYGSQQYTSYRSTRSRSVPTQNEALPVEKREPRSYTTRPLYNRQQINTTNSYQPRSRQHQEAQAYMPPPPVQRQQHSYPTDDYLPPIPADVVEEWDEDGGMVYGDWEEGGEVLIYQRDGMENTREPGPSYVEPTTLAADEDMRGHLTHDVREMRMPVASPLPQAVPVRPKEPARYQRMTQPLNPQVLLGLNRERNVMSEAQSEQRSQLVTQKQVQPTRMQPNMQKSICPKCRGAGFLRADVPFGHPNFGKPMACDCKEAERKEKRRQQLRDMSNLDAFRSNSFKTFNPRVSGVQEAFQISVEYAQNPDGWLLLIGPNGCGKTHLAAAIANQCLDSGAVVLFQVVPDLLDHLRAAFAPDAAEVYDQLFAKMREAEVLVLDDLGAQQSSPWANEKLFQLLNYRYNLGMPTVVTANPRGLQGIDERIRSRLSDNSLVISLTFTHARDYRPNHPHRD